MPTIRVQSLKTGEMYDREATPEEVERMRPKPSLAEVKAEARRRIEAAYPLWRQLNIIREGGGALAEMSAAIDAIRDKSGSIEAALPADYRDEKHWQ